MSNLLKSVFNRENVEKLAGLLSLELPEFREDVFIEAIFDEEWETRELKQRVRHVSHALQSTTGLSYCESLIVLRKVSVHFSGIFHFVFADYVGCFGLEDYDVSMEALAFFTSGSTSEYGIREFLNREPERTLQWMLRWTESENEHVRRLASEGARPRLPWATKLSWIERDPDRVLPIIEALKADQSAYVRKSVANLLNDLTKTRADWVLDLFDRWSDMPSDQHAQRTQWIIKHALRTLLKQANQRALALIGYEPPDFDLVCNWNTDHSVRIGERFGFGFSLNSSAGRLGRLRLEYALTFKRKQQGAYRKVFKIAEGDYEEVSRHFSKQHDFKPISTRRYYAGTHFIELVVNGVVLAASEFELLEAQE